jgi:hypothetical protein
MANPFQGDDEDPFEAARDSEGNVKQTGLAPSAKLSNFGAAFNMARKAGDKTFMFKGKKYTTDLAESKPKAKPAAGKKLPGKSAEGQMGDVMGAKKGGMIKKYAMGGSVGSASKRADGCATKGKTRGKMV